MKRCIIVSNWKSYISSLSTAQKLFNIICPERAQCIICPPTPFLAECKYLLEEKRCFSLGAQHIDIPEEYGGSKTGMTSPEMLKALKVGYCIVGHTEQRRAGDTDEIIKIKIDALEEKNITPIVCVGGDDKNTQKTSIGKQLTVLKNTKKKYILAYEPAYAIGVEKPADIEDIKNVVDYIRKQVKKNTPILYGGSVSGKHIQKLRSQTAVDGFLVGRASTKVSSIKEIMSYV